MLASTNPLTCCPPVKAHCEPPTDKAVYGSAESGGAKRQPNKRTLVHESSFVVQTLLSVECSVVENFEL